VKYINETADQDKSILPHSNNSAFTQLRPNFSAFLLKRFGNLSMTLRNATRDQLEILTKKLFETFS